MELKTITHKFQFKSNHSKLRVFFQENKC